MLRLAADENFNNRILRSLRRQFPELDILRVQDAGLAGQDDPSVLAWAAAEGRVLLTHDVATVPKFAYERIVAGQPMPGVIVVNYSLPIGEAAEEIRLVAECTLGDALEMPVTFVPMQ